MGVYQPLLCGINLILLCASTSLLYLGSILINFYLLPSLNLYSSNFDNVPYLIIALGVMLFIFSIFGFVATASKERTILIIYATIMGLTFILQLASIFCTIDFKNELELEEILRHHMPEQDAEMEKYWTDPDIQSKWDTLQRDFQCCGVGHGLSYHTGYKDWERVAANSEVENAKNNGVPPSCCLDEESGCSGSGSEIFQELRPERKIYVHGCMAVISKRLERDVQPVLLTYIVCAVVLALLEIISLVLASAYAAAISRKTRREEDRLGMYKQPLTSGSTKYSDILSNRAGDSGRASGTDSLRSNHSYRSQEDSLRLEAAPPRTPGGSIHRSSMYIEPSTEAGTVI